MKLFISILVILLCFVMTVTPWWWEDNGEMNDIERKEAAQKARETMVAVLYKLGQVILFVVVIAFFPTLIYYHKIK